MWEGWEGVAANCVAADPGLRHERLSPGLVESGSVRLRPCMMKRKRPACGAGRGVLSCGRDQSKGSVIGGGSTRRIAIDISIRKLHSGRLRLA